MQKSFHFQGFFVPPAASFLSFSFQLNKKYSKCIQDTLEHYKMDQFESTQKLNYARLLFAWAPLCGPSMRKEVLARRSVCTERGSMMMIFGTIKGAAHISVLRAAVFDNLTSLAEVYVTEGVNGPYSLTKWFHSTWSIAALEKKVDLLSLSAIKSPPQLINGDAVKAVLLLLSWQLPMRASKDCTCDILFSLPPPYIHTHAMALFTAFQSCQFCTYSH